MRLKKAISTLQGIIEHQQDKIGQINASGGAPSNRRLQNMAAIKFALNSLQHEAEYLERKKAEGTFHVKDAAYWDGLRNEQYGGMTADEIVSMMWC